MAVKKILFGALALILSASAGFAAVPEAVHSAGLSLRPALLLGSA